MRQSGAKIRSALPYGAALAVGAALMLWGALVYAPTERTMGDVQRIFYLHVAAAMNAAFAFLSAALGAVGRLATRRDAWDRLSRTATGLGVLWSSVVLGAGSVWARSAWGAWWTWEPRLTTSLLAWLIFVGALLVRRVAHDPDQSARLGAVVTLVGALDLPIIYFSVRWWRGQHPLVFGQAGGGLAPAMETAFWLGAVGVTLIHAALFGLSWRAARLSELVAAVERRMDEEGGLR